MTRTFRLWLGVALTGAAVAIFGGCSNSSTPSQQAPTEPADSHPHPHVKSAKKPGADGDDHAHKPGAHNGTIIEIGRDNYHAEAVFEKGGKLRLYTLGKDEAMVQEVEAQPVTAYVKAEGDMDAESFVLRPEPQTGDKPGMTSQFVGQIPAAMLGRKVEVTVTNFRIGTERFRFSFKNSVEVGHAGDPMPTAVAGADEAALFLTPGGKYTAADIKANGSVTAAQKFKGVKAVHDLKPKTGDKICPITLTKANTKFTWVVGGKSYEFCCPPCASEFVQQAKEQPDTIKEPDEYRKQ